MRVGATTTCLSIPSVPVTQMQSAATKTTGPRPFAISFFYDLVFLLARSSSLSLSLLSLLLLRLLELLELLEPSLPLLLLSDLRRLLPSFFLRRFLSCERFDK